MKRAQLEKYLLAWFDGDLNDAQQQALATRLKKDPEARRLYCRYASLHAGLRQAARANKELVGSARTTAFSGPRRRFKPIIWSAAAALVLGWLSAPLLLNSPESNEISDSTKVPASGPSLSVLASPGTRWATIPSEDAEDGILQQGTITRLKQGCLELTLESGVRSVVQAPAEFLLTKDNHLTLTSGNAWFDVPKAATGFQVSTPELSITDFGTRFGVISSENKNQAHLFQGEIAVNPASKPEHRQYLKNSAAVSLSENEELTSIPPNPDLFLERLPKTPVPVGAPYIRYSFDSWSVNQTPATGSLVKMQDYPATASEKPGPRTIPTEQGLGLRFASPEDTLQTSWPGISGNQARSLSFRLRLPSGQNRNNAEVLSWGAKRWESKTTNRRFGIDLLYMEGADQPQLLIDFGSLQFVSTDPIPLDDQWHHIAVGFNGEYTQAGQPKVLVMIDGKRTSIFSVSWWNAPRFKVPKLDTLSSEKNALRIGNSEFGPNFAGRNYGPLQADLDDLYLIEDPLTEEEFTRMSQGIPYPQAADPEKFRE